MEIDAQESLKNVEQFAKMGLLAINSVSGLVSELEKSEDIKDRQALKEVERAKNELNKALEGLKKIQFGA